MTTAEHEKWVRESLVVVMMLLATIRSQTARADESSDDELADKIAALDDRARLRSGG